MTSIATFHDLEGASVFITGGGSGIGAALTDGFLAQGANVTFVQRSDATPFVAEMADRHGRAPRFLPCDVTDIPALQAAMAEAAAAQGPITVLVNNAANDARHPVEGYTVAEWDAAQAVNLRPHFFTIQAAMPGMRAAGHGSIINFSSISYMIGAAGYLSYVAAKAGDHRPDLGLRPRPRPRPHPGQRAPARRGADRAPARALGLARGRRGASSSGSA